MKPFPVSAYTQTSAAGTGMSELRDSLRQRRSGLRPNDFPQCDLDIWIGRVPGLERVRSEALEPAWNSRNNALAALGLWQDGFLSAVEAACTRYGSHRVGCVIGTSTSSIGRSEEAFTALDADGSMTAEFRQKAVHHPHSPGQYVAWATGLTGPSLTVSTACASAARVFTSAQRWLEAGIVDAVLVGGVDSLCLTVLYGFSSLELNSSQPCRPFDVHRNGLNLGEAAGFALLEREEQEPGTSIWFAGYGESSDAFHMSQPHPEGEGARLSMVLALERAGLKSSDLGYINLHGTATRANDLTEALAVSRVFDQGVFASSTKGWTGHALGAAGIVEAVIAMDALNTGLLPGTINLSEPDPELAYTIERNNAEREVTAVLSNSFGFGGNNCSVVFRRGG